MIIVYSSQLATDPASKSNIIDVGGGAAWGVPAVVDDLDNMANALARHHGEQRAKDIMAEAFARAFAQWWVPGGRDISARFALEVALNNAIDAARAPQAATEPGGAA